MKDSAFDGVRLPLAQLAEEGLGIQNHNTVGFRRDVLHGEDILLPSE